MLKDPLAQGFGVADGWKGREGRRGRADRR